MTAVTRIFAIDPGTVQSAWVILHDDGFVRDFGIEPNDDVRRRLHRMGLEGRRARLAIEMIASYGMPVGREVFETCVWIGRFIEAASFDSTLVYRREIKLHLCNSARAKDANVRQALLDRYGPGREKAVGTKRKPGPLYGVSKDVWAALGVGVTFLDRCRTEQQAAEGARVEALG